MQADLSIFHVSHTIWKLVWGFKRVVNYFKLNYTSILLVQNKITKNNDYLSFSPFSY